MSHRFDSASLKSQDTQTAVPGFVWRLSPQGGGPHILLMLDSQNQNYRVWVHLSGERAFSTQYANMQALGAGVVLPLTTLPVNVELPEMAVMANNRETPGALIICNEGLFLAIRNVGDQGDYGISYVSMLDFTLHDDLPSRQYGVFTTWRITTSDPNPSERTILLSNGEWK